MPPGGRGAGQVLRGTDRRGRDVARPELARPELARPELTGSPIIIIITTTISCSSTVGPTSTACPTSKPAAACRMAPAVEVIMVDFTGRDMIAAFPERVA